MMSSLLLAFSTEILFLIGILTVLMTAAFDRNNVITAKIPALFIFPLALVGLCLLALTPSTGYFFGENLLVVDAFSQFSKFLSNKNKIDCIFRII